MDSRVSPFVSPFSLLSRELEGYCPPLLFHCDTDLVGGSSGFPILFQDPMYAHLLPLHDVSFFQHSRVDAGFRFGCDDGSVGAIPSSLLNAAVACTAILPVPLSVHSCVSTCTFTHFLALHMLRGALSLSHTQRCTHTQTGALSHTDTDTQSTQRHIHTLS